MNKNRIIVVLFIIAGVTASYNQVKAADCGGNPCNCNCGDTLTSDGTLTTPLDCTTFSTLTVKANLTLNADITSTEQGLIIGANNITIDGNGYSITGDKGEHDYGISNRDGYDNITIQNFANINNFGKGIYFFGSTGSTIQDNTVVNSKGTRGDGGVNIDLQYCTYNTIRRNTANFTTNGASTGIFLYYSSNNTLENNTANLNNNYGILLDFSNYNNLINNITNSNHNYGIYFNSSSSNIMTGNTMSGNVYNFFVTGTTNAHYNHTINTTNLVEGEPIYYLYNHSNETYDGVIGDIGTFWCILCDNVTIQNAILSPKNYYGIYFRSTTNSHITNVTSNLNNTGIYLYNSSSNDLSNNITNSNYKYGLKLSSSSSNDLINNIISNNRNGIYDNGSNSYEQNQFLYNLNNSMISFTEPASRVISLDGPVNFDIYMKNLDGTNCDTCTYSLTSSPSETFTPTKTDNRLTGSFTATKKGTYSLITQISDSYNNITKRNYPFFVEANGEKITRYYLRGISPANGKSGKAEGGTGNDSKSMLFEKPSMQEFWYCAIWVQNSPDEIPDFPISNLSSINIFSWYIASSVPPPHDSQAYIGVQRYETYSAGVDVNQDQSIPSQATSYAWINRNFTDLNWSMDYPWNWYWIALKLFGTGASWTTFPEGYSDQPSYADITYQYTTTPAVKSISNTDIIVLSATEPADGADNASIVLDGTGSTNIVLDDYKRPFWGYVTTINSDGTATLQASDIDTQTTINSVNMEVTPDSGLVDIFVAIWNTSGDYSKVWTETASAESIIAEHIAGDLAPNNYYSVTKDGELIGMYLSDSSGKIAFSSPAGSVFAINGLNTVFQAADSDEGGGGGNESHCFIATAAYGNSMTEEVMVLRGFRNEYLLTNPIGGLFVATYYKVSPPIAEFIRVHPTFRKTVKFILNPLIWMSREITE